MTKEHIPVHDLHDGYKIPGLGFGTVKMKGETAADAFHRAINNGYRLIDTAIRYDNEGAVGEGIRRSGVAREELFVTSKLRGSLYNYAEALESIRESLFRTGLEYFDLFLLHWPNPKQNKYVEAWKALIQAQKEGLVRSIGVSNFMPEHINRLVVIPKAESDEHQKLNIDIFDFELTDDEMKTIDELTQEHGRIDNQNPREYEEF